MWINISSWIYTAYLSHFMKILKVGLAIGIFCLPIAVIAANGDEQQAVQDTTNEQQETNRESSTDDEKQAAEKKSIEKNTDDFLPSEEISEDLSVSFPVDI